MRLDSGVTGAMATLVGASVFSIGFLTTRVHQALHRATDRATEIDDRLLDGRDFNPVWLDAQRKVLSEAVNDQFPRLVERAAGAFAALVLVLAIIAGVDAGFGDWPNPATLSAFVIGEAVIVWMGVTDRRRVAVRLARRLDGTLLKQMEDGIAAVNLASPDSTFAYREERAEAAHAIGEELVKRTSGAWPDAVGLVALAKVARDYDGNWTGGPKALDELTKEFADLTSRDPERHAWWATHARLAELAEDWDSAAGSWVRAESLPHRFRAPWSGHPFHLEPVELETFARALGQLTAQGRLHEDAARSVFGKLVSTYDLDTRGEDKVPRRVAAWLHRIARAVVDDKDLGFISAGSWLRDPEPFGVEWPALRAEAARVRQKYVRPAEQALDADPQDAPGVDGDAPG